MVLDEIAPYCERKYKDLLPPEIIKKIKHRSKLRKLMNKNRARGSAIVYHSIRKEVKKDIMEWEDKKSSRILEDKDPLPPKNAENTEGTEETGSLTATYLQIAAQQKRL